MHLKVFALALYAILKRCSGCHQCDSIERKKHVAVKYSMAYNYEATEKGYSHNLWNYTGAKHAKNRGNNYGNKSDNRWRDTMVTFPCFHMAHSVIFVMTVYKNCSVIVVLNKLPIYHKACVM